MAKSRATLFLVRDAGFKTMIEVWNRDLKIWQLIGINRIHSRMKLGQVMRKGITHG